MQDPFFSTIVERVTGYITEVLHDLGPCEYEYPESRYGAGDGLPCGQEAVGISAQHESPRCRKHMDA